MSLQDQNSGSVPSSGGDIGAELSKLLGEGMNPEEMGRLATAAARPVPTTIPTVPGSLQYQPKQWQNAPMDNRRPTTAAESKTQGISNAINGVLNAVGAKETEHLNNQKMQIATDTQTLILSQQAIDQATQAMNALPEGDPGRKQYQDMIDHNKTLMNGILSDPKTRKAIAKGYKIDFTNPSANQTMEHQAVAQGRELAKKSASYADKFAEAMPRGLQPNAQAQAQYQAALAQQKNQLETMKAFIPLLREMQRGKNQLSQESLKGQYQLAVKLQDGQNQLAKELAKHKDDMELAKYKHSLEVSLEYTKQHIKDTDPLEILKTWEATSKDMGASMDSISKERAAITLQISKEKDQGRIAELRTRDKSLQDTEAAVRSSYDGAKNYLARLLNVPADTLTVPTVSVGEGVTPNAGTGKASDNSNDVNPITGKPWGKDVSTVDKFLTKGIYAVRRGQLWVDRETENLEDIGEDKDSGDGN